MLITIRLCNYNVVAEQAELNEPIIQNAVKIRRKKSITTELPRK